MKQDRFLMVILGFIGLMVVVALVLFFVRQEPQNYVPEDNPEGVLRNYIMALQKGDYKRAYGYLWEAEYKPQFTTFHQTMVDSGMSVAQSGVQIGDLNVVGDEVSVNLTIIHNSDTPFDRGWNETSSALLIRQDGQWKIMSMPYPYWGWEWYVEK